MDLNFDVMQSVRSDKPYCDNVRQTGDEVTSRHHLVEMVTESQPLPELNASERSDRSCFFSLAPARHKGTIH